MKKRITSLLLSATLLVGLSGSALAKTQIPVSVKQPAIEFKAENYINQGDIENAIKEFNTIISNKSDPADLANAFYHLGLLYAITDQTDKSNECFSRLVIDHPASLWTKLALRFQVSDDILANLADKLYYNNDKRAIDIMDDLRKRSDNKKIPEYLYKTAIISKKYNLVDQAVGRLTELKNYPDSEWARMADLESKKEDPLKRVDEILKLKDVGNAKYHSVINTLRAHLDVNPKPEKLDEIYYQIAHSFLELESEVNAVDYLEKIAKNFPKSDKAPEALFWIGEINYRNMKKDPAKKSFDSLLKNYPDSLRAKEVAEWSSWTIDKKSEDYVFKTLKGLVALLNSQTIKGFGCDFFYESDNKTSLMEGRFALQQYLCFNLRAGKSDIKVAANKDGFFIHLPAQNKLYRSAEVSSPLVPQFKFNLDRIKDEVNVNFDFNTDTKSSIFVSNVKSDEDLKFIVKKMKLNTRHINIINNKDSQSMEVVMPSINMIPPERIKIELSGSNIKKVVYSHYDDKSSAMMNLRFDNIHLNEDIPYSYFDFQVPDKVDIIASEKAPFPVLLQTVMEMIGSFIQ